MWSNLIFDPPSPALHTDIKTGPQGNMLSFKVTQLASAESRMPQNGGVATPLFMRCGLSLVDAGSGRGGGCGPLEWEVEHQEPAEYEDTCREERVLKNGASLGVWGALRGLAGQAAHYPKGK